MEAPVENDQMATVENDQMVSIENDQMVTVENDQMVSIKDQMVSVESDLCANDEMVRVENDQMVRVENDQMVSINDQMASVASDQMVSVNDQLVSAESDQMVGVNGEMVDVENNHLAAIENDDLGNMETGELVNMEDHHHHEMVNMEEDHQLVSIDNNQLEPFENNELVPIENNDITSIDYNPLASIDHDQLDDVTTPTPNKRRKKKSVVWEHFTIETVSAGCRRACCKQCKQSFAYSTGSKVAGTSHLKRHIAKGTCPVALRNRTEINNDDNSTPYSAPSKMGGTANGTDPPKRRYRTASTVPYMGFNPDRCRREISRMVIMHDYPLHIVEHPGFIAFVKSLQPQFEMVSFNTVQGDCVATYQREKQALQKVIERIPGRICLTLDMWGSNLTTGYVFLTGSYIDTDWKLHRKLLNVVMEPYPESDSAFSHAVAACLSDWNMEGRLFTLTVNQSLSEGSIDNLRALLSIKNPLTLNGQLLVGNCLAHSLSSVAEEALTAAAHTVKKVRDSVKYVKTSESHEEKFLEVKQQLQVPSSKTLALDDWTRWNTTYEMLISASELKEVFSCLDTSDSDYKEAPSMEIWKQVETLCTFLKLLFETATVLSAATTPTTNTYFHEVWKIQLELVRAVQCEDPFVSSLAKAMKEKFDEYWKSCSLVLAIAVVMDPRFKMKLVEFSFSKIYGENAATYVKIVDEGIHELYLDYVAQPLPLTPTYMEEGNIGNLKTMEGPGGISNDGLGLTDFDMYIMESTSQQSRSELDQYLEESLLPRVHEFDVLGWWKINKTKYPTLSKMARDILTIPVCTRSPGLIFDTKRRQMDNYRCSLKPETVEALVCAKDWLKSVPVETLNSHVKMEFPI